MYVQGASLKTGAASPMVGFSTPRLSGVGYMYIIGALLLGFLFLVTFLVGSGNNGNAAVATFIFFPSVVALYFFPTIVAFREKHPRATPILALDLLLGWTAIGWVVSLIWALSPPQNAASAARSSSTPQAKWEPEPTMRKCPFCAEGVRAEAIKCKHCGSELESIKSVEATPLAVPITAADATWRFPSNE